jgi:hypothetical protein
MNVDIFSYFLGQIVQSLILLNPQHEEIKTDGLQP